jgi:hypothetical protein
MTHLTAGRPTPPPAWALAQGHLIAAADAAAPAFVRRYTRADGTLVWRDAWPGMDGSDDGYESFGNFPLFYALGGSAEIHDLARRQWEAVTRQFTAYGQVYREFDAYYDWMHHGESYIYTYFYGLADPTVKVDRDRAIAFAAMYNGEDPEADNWDAEHHRLRSPITGSRGPRFVNSAEDWVTHRPVLDNYLPPFEDIPGVPGPKCQWTDDAIFAEVLKRLNDRMMRADVPLNLTATSLMTHAFLYTGEAKYRDWVVDYTQAWWQRAMANGGIMPDNVGPNGIVGETMDGKWWGGYYGWRWPHGLATVIEPCFIAAANCLLLTGDMGWLDLPRGQLDTLCALGQRRDEGLWVPHRHGDSGWYDYRRLEGRFHLHLWYLSQRPDDWRRLCDLGGREDWDTVRPGRDKGDQAHAEPWVRYLEGQLPDYPEQILATNYAEMLRRLDKMAHDDGDPNEWDVHHWQDVNPVQTEALVQLTLGGPQIIYHGGLLHVRLRYFDPVLRRPGLPPGVAALVESLGPDGVTLRLVNCDPLAAKQVVLQAGAFGEHRFTAARADGGAAVPVGDRWLAVTLEPGCVADLELGMKRYAGGASYRRPWD